MEMFKESDKVITYSGNVEGKYYEVDYNKSNRIVTIRIDSNVLSYEHYKRAVGKIYESAVKEIKDIKDVKFEFYPTNELEKKNANSVINHFEINNKSSVMDKNEKIKKGIDEYFKANMIKKEENGKIKEYVERKVDQHGKEYVLEVSLGDMKEEFNSLLNDDSVNIDNLNDIEVANMVMDRIADRKKQYYMESSDKYEAKNEKEQAALNATNLDDRVNTEVGIVKRDSSESKGNSYRAIEQNGDKYNIVNPSVNEVSPIDNNNSDEVDLTNNEVESRDDEKIYYIDYYNMDIYNSKGELIGKIGQDYTIDNENNHLLKDGNDLGSIDDYKNMDKNINKNMSRSKVKTLEKTDNRGLVDIKVIVNIIILPLLIWVMFNYLIK